MMRAVWDDDLQETFFDPERNCRCDACEEECDVEHWVDGSVYCSDCVDELRACDWCDERIGGDAIRLTIAAGAHPEFDEDETMWFHDTPCVARFKAWLKKMEQTK